MDAFVCVPLTKEYDLTSTEQQKLSSVLYKPEAWMVFIITDNEEKQITTWFELISAQHSDEEYREIFVSAGKPKIWFNVESYGGLV